jgi:hypothetical protein
VNGGLEAVYDLMPVRDKMGTGRIGVSAVAWPCVQVPHMSSGGPDAPAGSHARPISEARMTVATPDRGARTARAVIRPVPIAVINYWTSIRASQPGGPSAGGALQAYTSNAHRADRPVLAAGWALDPGLPSGWRFYP